MTIIKKIPHNWSVYLAGFANNSPNVILTKIMVNIKPYLRNSGWKVGWEAERVTTFFPLC